MAVDSGKAIVAGTGLMEVMEKASPLSGHPYVALVGAEDAVVFRVRRTTFAYDQTYQPFPLPRVTVTFWNHAETHSQTHAEVIPDTGADLSVLPVSDCGAIDLFNSPCLTGMAAGVGAASATALFFQGKVDINADFHEAIIPHMPR